MTKKNLNRTSPPISRKMDAKTLLVNAQEHLDQRGIDYDSLDGERSMKATVEAFRAITGHPLTEREGWLFMVLLKAVRAQQSPTKLDSYEDGAAYFALAGESVQEKP